ncbi:MAG: ABC transporter ATP-binding protein [Celeribacter sp.]|jgi:peptide/nickel transport system ATP-binding protein
MTLQLTSAEGDLVPSATPATPDVTLSRRAPQQSTRPEPALALSHLTISAGGTDLVEDVSLSLPAGRTLCLVGESGCGKSLTCHAALHLLQAPLTLRRGGVRVSGHDLSQMPERHRARLRGREAAMIFQDPMNALNPVQRVRRQLAEVLRLHTDTPRARIAATIARLLQDVGIDDPARVAAAYPHELSGGMCQRVMIAMALASRPRLLIADEPTTALDVTIQAQILSLLRRVQRDTGMALLLVTHDLGVVAEMADDVAVMYAGRVVETGPVEAIFEAPQHPYTRALMGCRVQGATRPGTAQPLPVIAGTVPAPKARPLGCRFAPRCAQAGPECARLPALTPAAPSSATPAPQVACHLAQGRTTAPARVLA